MGKNILVMTGSPRRHGNSDLLADAFIRGAEAAGHIAEKYEAAFSKISGCRACDTCWKKGVPCSVNDDFNEKFVPQLKWADALVLCMPLYFYGFPSGVQATIEKIYSFLGENSPIKLKIAEAALLMCGGEKEMEIFSGAVATYEQLCKGMGWKNQGMVLAPGILEKGAVKSTVYLEQAEELGKKFI